MDKTRYIYEVIGRQEKLMGNGGLMEIAGHIGRQIQIIQTALLAFLEQKKKEYENLERATIRNQRPSEVKFSFKMDAEILPEVAQTIFENLGLKVCSSETQSIYGIFKV